MKASEIASLEVSRNAERRSPYWSASVVALSMRVRSLPSRSAPSSGAVPVQRISVPSAIAPKKGMAHGFFQLSARRKSDQK